MKEEVVEKLQQAKNYFFKTGVTLLGIGICEPGFIAAFHAVSDINAELAIFLFSCNTSIVNLQKTSLK